MREHELEEVFRQGLATLADEAEGSPRTVHRVLERARDGVGRRRRSGWVVAAAAALVVAVGAGVTVGLHGRGGVDEASPSPSPGPSRQAPDVPGGYRLEFWRDVAVRVPFTWGWGAAPVRTARGDAVLCGGRQLVQADGSRRDEAGLPYVGRPIMLADACDAGWASERPSAPYVWFDAATVTPGSVDLGGGWVRQTVAVGDVTVSVASDDPALRRAIVDSAHALSGECRPTLWNPPAVAGSTDPGFVPVSMTVCAYLATDTHLDYYLAYEQTLSMGPAKGLVAAVDSAPALGSSSCYSARGGEWALLRLRGEGGQFRDYVVDMSCPSIADPSGIQHTLTGDVVTAWAVGGINAVLHQHPLVAAPDRFIPPLP